MDQSNVAQSKNYLIYPWIICGVAASFYFFEYMLRVSPSVMTRQLMSAYHLKAASFGNLAASFYYIYAPMQLLVGVLMDRYGPRRLLTMAILVSSLGIYFFASSHYLLMADFGRILIGFGTAFAFVGVLKLATIWLPASRFALISGATMSLGMLGGIIGDITLTLLVQRQGWKLTCYLLACVGIILTIVIFILIRDRNKNVPQSDSMEHFSDFKTVFAGFFQLIKMPQIWINGVIGSLLFVSVAGFAETWGIPFLVHAKNFSHAEAASAISMIFLGWAIGGPIIGCISDVIKQRRLPITIGATLATIVMAYIIYVPSPTKLAIFILLFLLGLFSSVQAITFPVSKEISSPKLSGTAISLTNMITVLSGVSVFIIGAILDSVWQGKLINGLPYYSSTSYQIALSIIPVALLATVFLTFFLKETYSKQKQE